MLTRHLFGAPTVQPPTTQIREYALITGASQGLGRAFAEECARRRLNLILVALPESGLGQVAHDLAQRYGVRTEYVETDLTAPGSPEALCQWIADEGLPVLVLINNAGVGYNAKFEDSTLVHSRNSRSRINAVSHLGTPQRNERAERWDIEIKEHALSLLGHEAGRHGNGHDYYDFFEPAPAMDTVRVLASEKCDDCTSHRRH